MSGKANIIPQRTLVRGDLRYLSAAQLAEAPGFGPKFAAELSEFFKTSLAAPPPAGED